MKNINFNSVLRAHFPGFGRKKCKILSLALCMPEQLWQVKNVFLSVLQCGLECKCGKNQQKCPRFPAKNT